MFIRFGDLYINFSIYYIQQYLENKWSRFSPHPGGPEGGTPHLQSI